MSADRLTPEEEADIERMIRIRHNRATLGISYHQPDMNRKRTVQNAPPKKYHYNRPPGTCTVCGAATSAPQRTRCRDCFANSLRKVS